MRFLVSFFAPSKISSFWLFIFMLQVLVQSPVSHTRGKVRADVILQKAIQSFESGAFSFSRESN